MTTDDIITEAVKYTASEGRVTYSALWWHLTSIGAREDLIGKAVERAVTERRLAVIEESRLLAGPSYSVVN